MPHRIQLLLLSALLLIGSATAQEAEELVGTVEQDRLKVHIEKLASDELEGRLGGSAAEARAAEYIAQQLESFGLEALTDQGMVVDFPLVDAAVIGNDTYAELSNLDTGLAEPFEVWTEFIPLPFSANERVHGELVFCGYGLQGGDWDDFRDGEAEGRVALMLAGAPEGYEQPHSPAQKILNAQKHGARAAVILHSGRRPPGSHRLMKPQEHRLLVAGSKALSLFRSQIARILGTFKIGALDPEVLLFSQPQLVNVVTRRASGRTLDPSPWRLERQVDIPCLVMTPALVGDAFPEGQRSVEKLTASFEKTKGGQHVLLGTTLTVDVELERHRTLSRNVVAYLPPTTGDENAPVIAVGGHYDHLGRLPRPSGLLARLSRRKDFVWNGADDNASGTAAVMEVARVLAQKQERSYGVMFIAFGSEEYGLVGSRYYARNPLIPLERMRGLINLDMISENPDEPLMVAGEASGAGLPALVQQAASKLEEAPALDSNDQFLLRSDQLPFLQARVPAIFFSTGMHGDYHEASDEVGGISFERVAEVTRLAVALTVVWGEQDGPTEFQDEVLQGR